MYDFPIAWNAANHAPSLCGDGRGDFERSAPNDASAVGVFLDTGRMRLNFVTGHALGLEVGFYLHQHVNRMCQHGIR